MRLTLNRKYFIDINNESVKEMTKAQFVSEMVKNHSGKFGNEERAKQAFENIYDKIVPGKKDEPRKKSEK